MSQVILITSTVEGEWVDGEIRRCLYSARMISGQSHTQMLKQIIHRRSTESSAVEINSPFPDCSFIGYFPPGTTITPAYKWLKLVPVVAYPSPEWIETPTVGDCLADPRNLQVLQMYLRNAILGKYMTKQVGMDKKEPPGFRTRGKESNGKGFD